MSTFHPSKSTVKDETLIKFLYSDVEPDLKCIPGIGDQGRNALQDAGIENSYLLIAKFLAFKGNNVDVVTHCNLFYEWLLTVGIKTNRANITKSIAEKMSITFPHLYAESYFVMEEC